MTPDSLFQFANPLAVAGWAVLALAPLAPRLADRIAGLAIPALLSIGYAALILAFWAGAPGGFDSLPNVMALFTSPEIALAGWVHYLAFDLFVGAWEVRTARREAHPAPPRAAVPRPHLPVRPGRVSRVPRPQRRPPARHPPMEARHDRCRRLAAAHRRRTLRSPSRASPPPAFSSPCRWR